MKTRFALRPYLRAAFGPAYWSRAANGCIWALAPTGCAIFLALIFLPAPKGTTNSTRILDGAWRAVRSDMIYHSSKQFPSTSEVAKAIAVANPLLDVRVGDGLRYLEGHHPAHGSLFVKSVTPSHVTLEARIKRDGVVELDGGLGSSDTVEKTLYQGRPDPRFLVVTSIFAFLAFELLALLIAFGKDSTARRQRLGKAKVSRAALARWRSLVPDARFGPDRPEDDFFIWRPIKRDDDGIFDIYAEAVCWMDGDWRKSSGKTPPELYSVQMPLETEIKVATSAWVDFCQATASRNATNYRARLDVIEQERLRELEQRVTADDVLALEEQQAIAEHLPDAAELLRTLPLNS